MYPNKASDFGDPVDEAAVPVASDKKGARRAREIIMKL